MTVKSHKILAVSVLIVLSLNAYAKEESKDVIVALKKYAQPHGYTVGDYILGPAETIPTLTLKTFKPKNEYDMVSLIMAPVAAKNAKGCMASFGREYYSFKDAKKITRNGETYYKHTDEGVKFTSYLYYTFKNGNCYVIEGDAQLNPKLPANKSFKSDNFYTDVLKIYRDHPVKKNR